MKVYYTSDLHFTHKNICKFTDRPCSIEDHDDWVIDLWNSQVNRGDTVYHLGDLAFCGWNKRDTVLSAVERLNGNIILIKGNHDQSSVMDYICDHRKRGTTEWDKMREIHTAGTLTTLCHYAMYVWNQSHRGSYMLYGHSHGGLKDHPGKALDVGLDSAYNMFGQHKLFTDEDIIDYMATKSIFKPDFH